jgi:CubicO group peptidase (beta-lactamase class C family)
MGDAILESVLPAIEQRVAQQVTDAHLPGAAVGIVHGQELVWSQGFGYADIPSERRPDADTVYRVGSITKTFTATALVQLRDEGKLSLDDPLMRHLPEFAAVRALHGKVEDVTLLRLLTHRSGLMGEPPGRHWETLQFPTIAEIIASLPEVAIVIEPDSAFKYSNLGFALLGEVVARLSGRPYVEYVREQILEPLGMVSSGFALTDEIRSRMATGYDPDLYADEPLPSACPNFNGEAATGQLYSTVNDLARWIAFQFREQGPERNGVPVLSGRSLREMHRPLYMEPGWSEGTCLPWMGMRRGDNVFLGHGGGIHGFTTQILFHLEHSLGAIVLLNGTGPSEELAVEMVEMVIKAKEAAPKAAPEVSPAPVPAAWRPYLGRYARAGLMGRQVQVECRNGALLITVPSAPGRAAQRLTRLELGEQPHRFLAKDQRFAGEFATFSLAADGTVTGFDLGGFPFHKLVEARG